jgi:hypothetical protein
MNYKQYRVEDFVLDHNFKEWVLHRRNAHNAFWELWIAENNDKYEVIKEARQIVLILHNLFTPEVQIEIESRWVEVCN